MSKKIQSTSIIGKYFASRNSLWPAKQAHRGVIKNRIDGVLYECDVFDDWTNTTLGMVSLSSNAMNGFQWFDELPAMPETSPKGAL